MEPWERERKEHDDEIEAKKERSRRRKKKREKAKRERHAKAARRQRGRRRPKGHREVTGPAVCPSCGDGDRLFTIEAITGHARGTARLETGVLHFEHDGTNEIDYDSSTTIGAGCDCGWRGMSSELVLAS